MGSEHADNKRWVRTTSGERSGNVKFSRIRNDGKRERFFMLLRMKNVFVKLLPNVPRPCVRRLVLDRKQENSVLLNRNKKGHYVVMRGRYYRPFTEQEFGEIGFLAICQTEHVRGYDSRL